jgi:hypothetical protein
MERRLAGLLEEVAAPHVPAYFDAMIARAVGGRQRRAWLPELPTLTLRAQVVPLVLLTTLLALLVWAAAIGSQRAVPRPSPFAVHELLAMGWQARPVVVPPDLAAQIDARCSPLVRRQVGALPRLVLDVRGGHVAHALYTDGSAWSVCEVPVESDGTLSARVTLPSEAGPAATRNPMMGAEEPPRHGLGGSTGSSWGYGESAAGRIAPIVSRVEIVLRDGRRVEASVGGGWYVAWWPAEPPVTASDGGIVAVEPTMDRVEGFDDTGTLVTGVNGWLLPAFQPRPTP